MRLRLLALLAASLLLPCASASLSLDPERLLDGSMETADGATETLPVEPESALPDRAKPRCLSVRGVEAGIGFHETFCPDDLPGWSQENQTAGSSPGNATAAEDLPPAAPAPVAGEPAAAPGPDVLPLGATPAPLPQRADEPAPAPALPSPEAPARPALAEAAAPAGLSAWTAAAAAAAIAIPSALALKFASLLALRRRAASPLPAAILGILEREPGIHHMDLVRRIGKGNGTVEHHVQRLVAEGRVKRVRTPGYTHYFLAGPRTPGAAEACMAARNPTSRRMAEAVAQRPQATLSELAHALGVALSTAHHHAAKLVAAGVLADARRGAQRAFTLTEAGRGCLAPPAAAPPLAGGLAGVPCAGAARPETAPRFS